MLRKLTLYALVIGLLSGIYFFARSAWHEEKIPTTIALSKTPLSSPFYIAQHLNAFKDTCVDVKLIEVVGGLAAFQKIINKEADFATSSNSVIAFQSLSKHQFVTHSVFSQSDNDVKLLTRTADNIINLTDLQGKKIGVIKETASEYFLSILLALDGLTINDVRLINYQPQALSQALVDKEVDAIALWEPFVFKAKNKFSQVLSIHNTKALISLSFNLLSDKTAPQLREKAQCVLQGLSTAIEYIALKPEQSKVIIQKALNLSPDFIDWVWSDYIFKLSLNNSLIQSIKSQATWAVASQNLKDSAQQNVMNHIDSRALLMVDPQAVNIQTE